MPRYTGNDSSYFPFMCLHCSLEWIFHLPCEKVIFLQHGWIRRQWTHLLFLPMRVVLIEPLPRWGLSRTKECLSLRKIRRYVIGTMGMSSLFISFFSLWLVLSPLNTFKVGILNHFLITRWARLTFKYFNTSVSTRGVCRSWCSFSTSSRFSVS